MTLSHADWQIVTNISKDRSTNEYIGMLIQLPTIRRFLTFLETLLHSYANMNVLLSCHNHFIAVYCHKSIAALEFMLRRSREIVQELNMHTPTVVQG